MSRSGARGRILARVREALEGRDRHPHPEGLATASTSPPPSRSPLGERATVVELFAEAFRRSGGEVVRLSDEGDARAWLAEVSADWESCATGAGLPDALRPDASDAPPAAASVGVSRALAAAADTGTVLLSGREGRAVQLLPPEHLVWVDAADVHASLADALDAVREPGLPPVFALHSGPSKSADIGQVVVRGVHGPGRVVVAVVGDLPPGSSVGER